ncbi:hypothetical protein B0T19DRAFT_433219 [Cercophora scortea]|uniref:DUF7371 domain-containing protein n=1 Tax=Cercophora scortea TaxID=314031 RepID=A0AAE0I7D9_9PEZI|nr:hypothetical protein B0T19DRAFT_433219 [Cercophora scortea]
MPCLTAPFPFQLLTLLQFDDIPTLSTGNFTNPNSFPLQPVPFPYHRFFFSNGFHVSSLPTSRYQPSSGSQLVQYNASLEPIAQIGLAELRTNPCFRFAFLGISLGCNSTTEPCVFNVAGLQWDGVDEVAQGLRTFEVAACSTPANCTLSHQILDSAAQLQFANLTAINITLTVAGQPQTWWGDDLQFAWADNDCIAASCRARVPNTIMFPHNSRTFAKTAKSLLRWAVRRQNVDGI